MAVVLVVEDEPDLRALLAHHLEGAGHVVQEAGSIGEAGRLLAAHTPDLLVLDRMLPDGSGLDLCRALRRQPATRDLPVLLLTALGSEADRVQGFEGGADDYVVKPGSPRELVLRVQALLRRRGAPAEAMVLTVGDLVAEPERHRVTVAGQEVRLTALEFKLLVALMQRPGEVLSRRQLLAEVWGVSPNLQTRTVDTHVQRLRERLGAAPSRLETVHGVGYRLRAEP
jgi:two-component system phosphate regulon response regulator PhoB